MITIDVEWVRTALAIIAISLTVIITYRRLDRDIRNGLKSELVELQRIQASLVTEVSVLKNQINFIKEKLLKE